MEYIEYVTKDGDRWDLIAWQMYGNAGRFEPIIAANPGVPIGRHLKGGITLRVPVLDATTSITAGMPPWKK